jgi:hypothetical protein
MVNITLHRQLPGRGLAAFFEFGGDLIYVSFHEARREDECLPILLGVMLN